MRFANFLAATAAGVVAAHEGADPLPLLRLLNETATAEVATVAAATNTTAAAEVTTVTAQAAQVACAQPSSSVTNPNNCGSTGSNPEDYSAAAASVTYTEGDAADQTAKCCVAKAAKACKDHEDGFAAATCSGTPGAAASTPADTTVETETVAEASTNATTVAEASTNSTARILSTPTCQGTTAETCGVNGCTFSPEQAATCAGTQACPASFASYPAASGAAECPAGCVHTAKGDSVAATCVAATAGPAFDAVCTGFSTEATCLHGCAWGVAADAAEGTAASCSGTVANIACLDFSTAETCPNGCTFTPTSDASCTVDPAATTAAPSPTSATCSGATALLCPNGCTWSAAAPALCWGTPTANLKCNDAGHTTRPTCPNGCTWGPNAPALCVGTPTASHCGGFTTAGTCPNGCTWLASTAANTCTPGGTGTLPTACSGFTREHLCPNGCSWVAAATVNTVTTAAHCGKVTGDTGFDAAAAAETPACGGIIAPGVAGGCPTAGCVFLPTRAAAACGSEGETPTCGGIIARASEGGCPVGCATYQAASVVASCHAPDDTTVPVCAGTTATGTKQCRQDAAGTTDATCDAAGPQADEATCIATDNSATTTAKCKWFAEQGCPAGCNWQAAAAAANTVEACHGTAESLGPACGGSIPATTLAAACVANPTATPAPTTCAAQADSTACAAVTGCMWNAEVATAAGACPAGCVFAHAVTVASCAGTPSCTFSDLTNVKAPGVAGGCPAVGCTHTPKVDDTPNVCVGTPLTAACTGLGGLCEGTQACAGSTAAGGNCRGATAGTADAACDDASLTDEASCVATDSTADATVKCTWDKGCPAGCTFTPVSAATCVAAATAAAGTTCAGDDSATCEGTTAAPTGCTFTAAVATAACSGTPTSTACGDLKTVNSCHAVNGCTFDATKRGSCSVNGCTWNAVTTATCCNGARASDGLTCDATVASPIPTVPGEGSNCGGYTTQATCPNGCTWRAAASGSCTAATDTAGVAKVFAKQCNDATYANQYECPNGCLWATGKPNLCWGTPDTKLCSDATYGNSDNVQKKCPNGCTWSLDAVAIAPLCYGAPATSLTCSDAAHDTEAKCPRGCVWSNSSAPKCSGTPACGGTRAAMTGVTSHATHSAVCRHPILVAAGTKTADVGCDGAALITEALCIAVDTTDATDTAGTKCVWDPPCPEGCSNQAAFAAGTHGGKCHAVTTATDPVCAGNLVAAPAAQCVDSNGKVDNATCAALATQVLCEAATSDKVANADETAGALPTGSCVWAQPCPTGCNWQAAAADGTTASCHGTAAANAHPTCGGTVAPIQNRNAADSADVNVHTTGDAYERSGVCPETTGASAACVWTAAVPDLCGSGAADAPACGGTIANGAAGGCPTACTYTAATTASCTGTQACPSTGCPGGCAYTPEAAAVAATCVAASPAATLAACSTFNKAGCGHNGCSWKAARCEKKTGKTGQTCEGSDLTKCPTGCAQIAKPTQATATLAAASFTALSGLKIATNGSGAITGVTLAQAGVGYTTLPTVTPGADGDGAGACTNVAINLELATNGAVTLATPAFTGTSTGCTNSLDNSTSGDAAATSSTVDSWIQAITTRRAGAVTVAGAPNGGSGYQSTPTVAVASPCDATATVTMNAAGTGVSSVAMTPGTLCTGTDVLTFSGGGVDLCHGTPTVDSCGAATSNTAATCHGTQSCGHGSVTPVQASCPTGCSFKSPASGKLQVATITTLRFTITTNGSGVPTHVTQVRAGVGYAALPVITPGNSCSGTVIALAFDAATGGVTVTASGLAGSLTTAGTSCTASQTDLDIDAWIGAGIPKVTGVDLSTGNLDAGAGYTSVPTITVQQAPGACDAGVSVTVSSGALVASITSQPTAINLCAATTEVSFSGGGVAGTTAADATCTGVPTTEACTALSGSTCTNTNGCSNHALCDNVEGCEWKTEGCAGTVLGGTVTCGAKVAEHTDANTCPTGCTFSAATATAVAKCEGTVPGSGAGSTCAEHTTAAACAYGCTWSAVADGACSGTDASGATVTPTQNCEGTCGKSDGTADADCDAAAVQKSQRACTQETDTGNSTNCVWTARTQDKCENGCTWDGTAANSCWGTPTAATRACSSNSVIGDCQAGCTWDVAGRDNLCYGTPDTKTCWDVAYNALNKCPNGCTWGYNAPGFCVGTPTASTCVGGGFTQKTCPHGCNWDGSACTGTPSCYGDTVTWAPLATNGVCKKADGTADANCDVSTIDDKTECVGITDAGGTNTCVWFQTCPAGCTSQAAVSTGVTAGSSGTATTVGVGYVSAPAITFTGGAGSGAAASAKWAGGFSVTCTPTAAGALSAATYTTAAATTYTTAAGLQTTLGVCQITAAGEHYAASVTQTDPAHAAAIVITWASNTCGSLTGAATTTAGGVVDGVAIAGTLTGCGTTAITGTIAMGATNSDAGKVRGITITTAGSGYTTAPTVGFTYSGAAASTAFASAAVGISVKTCYAADKDAGPTCAGNVLAGILASVCADSNGAVNNAACAVGANEADTATSVTACTGTTPTATALGKAGVPTGNCVRAQACPQGCTFQAASAAAACAKGTDQTGFEVCSGTTAGAASTGTKAAGGCPAGCNWQSANAVSTVDTCHGTPACAGSTPAIGSDGSGKGACPAGCSWTAAVATATCTGTPKCGGTVASGSAGGCPAAGCTYTAAAVAATATCTGTPTTESCADLGGACEAVSAVSCTGTEEAECPSGCTWKAASSGATCTDITWGQSYKDQTNAKFCDDAKFNTEATCPSGCTWAADTTASAAICHGTPTEPRCPSFVPGGTTEVTLAACPNGCTFTAGSCSGTAAGAAACSTLAVTPCGSDAGCTWAAATCGTATETQSCDATGHTATLAAGGTPASTATTKSGICPAGCQFQAAVVADSGAAATAGTCRATATSKHPTCAGTVNYSTTGTAHNAHGTLTAAAGGCPSDTLCAFSAATTTTGLCSGTATTTVCTQHLTSAACAKNPGGACKWNADSAGTCNVSGCKFTRATAATCVNPAAGFPTCAVTTATATTAAAAGCAAGCTFGAATTDPVASATCTGDPTGTLCTEFTTEATCPNGCAWAAGPPGACTGTLACGGTVKPGEALGCPGVCTWTAAVSASCSGTQSCPSTNAKGCPAGCVHTDTVAIVSESCSGTPTESSCTGLTGAGTASCSGTQTCGGTEEERCPAGCTWSAEATADGVTTPASCVEDTTADAVSPTTASCGTITDAYCASGNCGCAVGQAATGAKTANGCTLVLATAGTCGVSGCSFNAVVPSSCEGTPSCDFAAGAAAPTAATCGAITGCTLTPATAASKDWQLSPPTGKVLDGDANATKTWGGAGYDKASCWKNDVQQCSAFFANNGGTAPSGGQACSASGYSVSASLACAASACAASDESVCCFDTTKLSATVSFTVDFPTTAPDAKTACDALEAGGIFTAATATIKTQTQVGDDGSVTITCGGSRRRLPAAGRRLSTGTVALTLTAEITGLSALAAAGLSDSTAQAGLAAAAGAEVVTALAASPDTLTALGITADDLDAVQAAFQNATVVIAFKKADGTVATVTDITAGAATAQAQIEAAAAAAAADAAAAAAAAAAADAAAADDAADDADSGAFSQNVALTVLFAVFSRFLF